MPAGSRRVIALCNADTASKAVRCSVMSVSLRRFGADAYLPLENTDKIR